MPSLGIKASIGEVTAHFEDLFALLCGIAQVGRSYEIRLPDATEVEKEWPVVCFEAAPCRTPCKRCPCQREIPKVLQKDKGTSLRAR